jgi:DNA-directed RNA polymerase specialized sigma subunit
MNSGESFPKYLIKEIPKITEKLTQAFGREPLDEEVATEIGCDVDDVRQLKSFKVVPENEEEEKEFELKYKLTIKNNELEKARLSMGLLQEEVAKKIGIGAATYCAIECCRDYPTPERIEKLCKFFQKESHILFPEWLKMFSEKWKDAKKTRIVPISQVSLDTPEVMFLESGDEEEMLRSADNEVIKNKLNEIMSTFTEKQKDIVQRRMNGETFYEIGKRYGLSSTRVNQIYLKGEEQIRNHSYFKGMKNSPIY